VNGVRDQVKRALVLDYWRSGRRSTEEIARAAGIGEDDVCRILEDEQRMARGRI
jgi:hypothetical protein